MGPPSNSLPGFLIGVLVASLTPSIYRSDDNPSGQPPAWFDAIRAGLLGNRAEFFRFVPENPFYGYNLDGAKPSEAVIANWWRQGMAGGAPPTGLTDKSTYVE